MKILYFSPDYGPHDQRFLGALAHTSHDVFFLRLEKGPAQIGAPPVPSRIRLLRWSARSGPFRWRDVPGLVAALRRVVREVQPDLIHAGPIQTCAFLSVLSGFRPVLSMSWGFDLMEDAERNAWWRWITRFTLKHTTFFTSDARVTRKRAIAYGMRSDRTSIFPWGVDLEQFRPADGRRKEIRRLPIGRQDGGVATRRVRPTKHSFVLLCNRSWEPRYGVDVLARAFVLAAREDPSLFLILLGNGSRAQSIRQTLNEGGQAQRVIFVGYAGQSAMARWYQLADLYISPSHIDGSSVSLMEALASGLPALVSDIPANREWVREDENGWLFPDGDHEALAQRLVSIAGKRSHLRRIARAARATAVRRADWGKNFKILMNTYERAVRVG